MSYTLCTVEESASESIKRLSLHSRLKPNFLPACVALGARLFKHTLDVRVKGGFDWIWKKYLSGKLNSCFGMVLFPYRAYVPCKVNEMHIEVKLLSMKLAYRWFIQQHSGSLFHSSPENCSFTGKAQNAFKLSSGILNNFLAEKCPPYWAFYTLVINHPTKFHLNLIYYWSKRRWEFTCMH